jgi:HK97 family phage prohead protease
MSTEITKNLPEIERRFTVGSVEIRKSETEGDKKRTVRGYAAKFGVRSENLGGKNWQFYETIQRGAFDDVLENDVRALFNHDANLILARSKGGKGTLRFGVDDIGLWYEFEAPATRAGDDLLVSLERGDVDQSSFAFTVERDGQVWTERTENEVTVAERMIKKVKRLFDVSPVTYPAYADTSVAARSLQETKASEQAAADAEKQAAEQRSENAEPNFTDSDRDRRLRILKLTGSQ